MADFKRKSSESFEGFLRKFRKSLRNSKRLEQARSKQYLEPRKTKRLQKKHALNGLALSKKNEYLRRIGKLPESNAR